MTSSPEDYWRIDEADFPAQDSLWKQMEFLLRYAILAPSGHNTQPWRFRLLEDHLVVLADRTRALPVVDPYDRELTISCGAAIGHFEVAAAHFGLATNVTYRTDPAQPDVLAIISVEVGGQAAAKNGRLFNAIVNRRTSRSAYEPKPLPQDLLKKCHQLATDKGIDLVVVEDGMIKTDIASLVAEGDQLQFDDPGFRRELASWVHSARLGSRDGMSGAGFGMPDLLSPVGGFVIRTFDLGDSVAAGDKAKIESGSPALFILGSKEDGPTDWLNTGIALSSILLAITASGHTASYLNQPIEVETLRRKLKRAAWMKTTPQILLRVGRAKKQTPPTVRRPLDHVISL